MGVDYSGRFIVGLKMEGDDLAEEKVVPNCKHNPPQDVRFCPDCGTRVGQSRRIVYPDWWRGDEDWKLETLDMIPGTDRRYVIVGKVLQSEFLGDHLASGAMLVPTFTGNEHLLREEIVATLIKRGARLDEIKKGTFGFWFTIHASY
jgi:hypothetical protein